MPDPTVLDNAAYAALCTRHAEFAEREGRVARYPDAMAPFVGIPDVPDDQDWHDLAVLLRRTGLGALLRAPVTLPEGWAREYRFDVYHFGGVQYTGAQVRAGGQEAALTHEDVPAMLKLVERAEPGPFRTRTIDFGGYQGSWRDGELAAMAGQRFSVATVDGGWTELSAVCTDPRFRGQGLATRLIRALTAHVRERGDEVFLHAAQENTNAIALYERLGFVFRRRIQGTVLRPLD